MGWKLERKWHRGRRGWSWFVYNSAYGSGGGWEPTKALAKVKMAIAEADIFEMPYPKFVVEQMLANPEEASKEMQG